MLRLDLRRCRTRLLWFCNLNIFSWYSNISFFEVFLPDSYRSDSVEHVTNGDEHRRPHAVDSSVLVAQSHCASEAAAMATEAN